MLIKKSSDVYRALPIDLDTVDADAATADIVANASDDDERELADNSAVSPLAPLFAIILNFLKIRTNAKQLTKYSKRTTPKEFFILP